MSSSPLAVDVLGCSGSYADVDGACTGYLIRTPGANVWLDCGPGTLANLQKVLDLDQLTAVVCTHSHPDHWGELPVFRNAWKYYLRRAPIAVYGTAETRDLCRAVCGADMADTLDWTVTDPASELHIGDQRWTFALTDHPVETLAPRIESGGRTFGFTADTGPAWSLESLGPGLDLALVEATIHAADEGQGIPHLSSREAGRMAAEAGVSRLVLTHLAPGLDSARSLSEAEAEYGAPVELARAGHRLAV